MRQGKGYRGIGADRGKGTGVGADREERSQKNCLMESKKIKLRIRFFTKKKVPLKWQCHDIF